MLAVRQHVHGSQEEGVRHAGRSVQVHRKSLLGDTEAIGSFFQSELTDDPLEDRLACRTHATS